MAEELQLVDPKEFGLEKGKAKTIESSFFPKVAEREVLTRVYENILSKEISKDVCEEASTLRKKLVKVRTGIAAIHKTEKEYFLAAGKYIDSIKNKLTLPVTQMEEQLSNIEKYYERLEQERIDKLVEERLSKVHKFDESVSRVDVESQSEAVFESFLFGLEAAYNKRIEEEALAEKKRIEEERIEAEKVELSNKRQIELRPYYAFLDEDLDLREMPETEYQEKLKSLIKAKSDKDKEDERIRKENETLRIEAEKKEKERLAKEKEEKEIQAKLKAEADARLKAEQEAKAKLEAELKAKRDAEIAEQQAKEEAEAKKKAEQEAILKQGDKAILRDWINKEFPTPEKPKGLKDKGDSTSMSILEKYESFKSWAKKQIEEF